MKSLLPAIVLSLVIPAFASAGEVKLQLANGRVTLQARDASVSEILAEWARVGQVKIVNAEKIVGAPVTLDLQGVPENQALATLLRSVSGFVAAPRTGTAGASLYDRIVIMAAPRSANTTAYTQSTPQQPQFPYRGMPPGLSPQPQILDDQDQPVAPSPTYPGMMPSPRPAPGQQQAPQPGQLPTGAPGTVSPMPQTQPLPPGMQQPTTTPTPGVMPSPGTVTPGAPGTIAPPPKRPGGPGGPGGDGGASDER